MHNNFVVDRTHVTIFGETNVGKSSIFNAIVGSDSAIVSNIRGTTTDPFKKTMELLPFGPIVLTDTAGINDNTPLGKKRIEKTMQVINKTDFAIYVFDIKNSSYDQYLNFKSIFDLKKIPHTVILSKIDLYDKTQISEFYHLFENFYEFSIFKTKTSSLKNFVSKQLNKINIPKNFMLDGILKKGDLALLVVPIDTEAPAGRLILPQINCIRNCLDICATCHVTTLDNLEFCINNLPKIDLIITDSQAFKEVDSIVQDLYPITSFSILMARQKGNFEILLDGINAIKNLNDNDKILICEACTHNYTHDDIGQVQIPNLLKKLTNKNILFDFALSRDYPQNLCEYSLIVHCGACMITSSEMQKRILQATSSNIPITNYGLLIAHANGILEKSIKIIGDIK